MCGCVYMCITVVVGMHKNHYLVVIYGWREYACIPSVCIFHIMHVITG